MNKIVCFLLACSLLSCVGKVSKQNQTVKTEIVAENVKYDPSQLPRIDVTKEYPKKEINIREVADVEYIPLETRSDVLLDGGAVSRVCMSDSLLVLCNREDGAIFVFNRQGRILHVFNHKGRSGEEYLNIIGFTVDFSKHEIYIYDFYLRNRILVYGYDGTFKRILRVPAELWFKVMINYDAEYLLCYDTRYLREEEDGGKSSKRPYWLVSKKDGKWINLDISFNDRQWSWAKIVDTDVVEIVRKNISIPWDPIIKNGENILINEWTCDTIYRLKDKKFLPEIVKTPSRSDSSVPVLSNVYMKTGRFVFISSVKTLIERYPLPKGGLPTKECVYDYQTGLIYDLSFINEDYVGYRFPTQVQIELPGNYALEDFSASSLLEAKQKNKLNGRLKEIVSGMQEDDNPVLMLVKFK